MNSNTLMTTVTPPGGDQAQVELRPMQEDDLPTVVAIITEHDEDDGEEAQASYSERGFDDQFVLVQADQVLGVTGYRYAQGTLGTAWLGWTYLRKTIQQQGWGTWMLNALLQRLRDENYRKVFVSTSDYVDPQAQAIYAAASRLYQNVGFQQEVRHPDYFAVGESQMVYGLSLRTAESGERVQAPVDHSCVFFNGLFEIPETDDVYVINWAVQPKKLFGRASQFTRADLEIGLQRAREWEARSVFISFPSNMPSVLLPLQEAGFFEEGRLKDYYEDGVDEIRFRHNL